MATGSGANRIGPVSFSKLCKSPFWKRPALGLWPAVGSIPVFSFASVLRKRRPALRTPVHQSLCIHMLAGAMLFGLYTAFPGNVVSPRALGSYWGDAPHGDASLKNFS